MIEEEETTGIRRLAYSGAMSQGGKMSEYYRILIVDDNHAIHEDFKKILQRVDEEADADFLQLETLLFDQPIQSEGSTIPWPAYEIHDAFQGEEAIELVDKAEQEGRAYTLIFMDVRMPPGMDGIQTIIKIWEKNPTISVVLCTAYPDYSWQEMETLLGHNDRWLFIKKPFQSDEIQRLAHDFIERRQK
jgi:CheY-like chemotaxis protein